MMEGLDESAVKPPPAVLPPPPHLPPNHPHSPSSVSTVRLHTSADFLLPATFLAITIVGILFVLLILIIWIRSHLSSSSKQVQSSKDAHYLQSLDDGVQHFKVIVDSCDEQMDEFRFKLPSDIKYIDEDVGSNVSPLLVNMQQSGGSSPKCTDEPSKDDNKESNESTPSSASKSKFDTKFVFPPSEDGASTSKGKTSKFKVALPEQQWILHRKPPLDFRGYAINIPKSFGLLNAVKTEVDVDSAGGSDPPKKFNATRSPSLEKDDKSPLILPQKDIPVMFGFGCDTSQASVSQKVTQDSGRRSGNSSPIVEVRVQPLTTDVHHSLVDKSEPLLHKSEVSQSIDVRYDRVPQEKESKTVISRRFGTCNNLRINTSADNLHTSLSSEKLEMQNSPRTLDSIIGKENNPSPRFSYSPKFFATPDSKSPKFFGTPDQKSPKFFATPDPKSPAFFADAQSRTSSPRVFEKASSPRLTSTSSYKSVQSPLIISNSGGECFMFDRSELLNYGESTSVDEIDSVFITNKDSMKQLESEMNQDVVLNNILTQQCESVLLSPIKDGIESERNTESTNDSNKSDTTESECDFANDNKSNLCDNLAIPSSNCGNTANYRRQRLKSISLDSDNAKFIEQNLGISMVKHLKQENLFDPEDRDKTSAGRIEISSPKTLEKTNYFRFEDVQFNTNNNENESEEKSIPDISANDSDSMRTSPDNIISPKCLREASSVLAFTEMQPRFSPKEFDEFDMETCKSNKNVRNLTIDINKRDEELVNELREYDHLESGEKRLTPKTPTLKIKATSLDSSETLNLSLPQSNTLQVPQNSISVPNTPKRHLKRTLSQKSGKLGKAGHYNYAATNLNEIGPKAASEAHQRKLFMSIKCPSNYIDSGIFLRENHANLMLFQASKYPMSRSFNNNASNFSRRMGSFDENMVDLTEFSQQIPVHKELSENRLSLPGKPCDNSLLGSNLSNFKQNLSVSSTNLKTLPEGVPSNDFDTHSNDGKQSKKTLLQRRGSNQSLTINLDTGNTNLKYSTLSLQSSNLSLASFGASSHNLTNIKNSASNFSLNTDNRQKKNVFERRNSNNSLTLNLDYATQQPRLYATSNSNLQNSSHNLNDNKTGKKCLLQRRGSNTSLTLNLQSASNSNLNRCISNSSLNIQNDGKLGRKKGLLERRSSNTSLTLNICAAGPQIDTNRVLSVSNYNLDGAGCNSSHYNSNQSINNTGEQKKGLLERRNSNTSLSLNLNNYVIQGGGNDTMRYIEIDDSEIQKNYECKGTDNQLGRQQTEKHRKSLSTENLFPKSYKYRGKQCENVYSFGSHDNLWSYSYSTDSCAETSDGNNLTYICGDQENEMIYAFGDRQHLEQAGLQGVLPVRNITTKPLSPHSTSEDFKMYLANIQHLQNASNILTRQQLKDLNTVFQDGYSKSECPLQKKSPIDILTSQLSHLTLDKPEGDFNPQRVLPDPVGSSVEYQKSLLRNLHQEFWDLPTNFQEKPMVFGSHPKNRYKTILPNEHSRVILRPEAGQLEEGYINANYIKGHEFSKNCYIATQGPLQNTIYDFWLMVYQNSCQFHKNGCTKTNEDRHFGSPQAKNKKSEDSKNSPDEQVGIQKIVMLTNLIENGRQKCEKYFPIELNEEMEFKCEPPEYSTACGETSFFVENETTSASNRLDDSLANSFKVKNIGITHKTGYTIRKLLVEYINKQLDKNNTANVIESLFVKHDPKHTAENFEIIVNEPESLDSSKKNENTTSSLIVYHYWFDNWADHKCPADVTALLELSIDVMQNKILYFDKEPNSTRIEKKVNLHPRSEFVALRAKSFDKTELSLSQRHGMDKSLTNLDFTLFSKEKLSDSNKGSNLEIDLEGIPRERRLSAFQLAKAFFDEVSKASGSNEDSKNTLRKNSLASRLDLPKNKLDLQNRRESTGKIDSKYLKDHANENEKSSKATTSDVNQAKSTTELKEMPPIIVHCSAGIGRTGCLIAIVNGIRQMKADQRVDILGIVCNMRLNRGGMVQNSEQYELIHKVLCLYEHLGIPDYQ